MVSSSFQGTQIPPLQALTKFCGIEKSGPGATSVSSALAEGPYIVKYWQKKAASLGLSLARYMEHLGENGKAGFAVSPRNVGHISS